jgi:hypothetical protein
MKTREKSEEMPKASTSAITHNAGAKEWSITIKAIHPSLANQPISACTSVGIKTAAGERVGVLFSIETTKCPNVGRRSSWTLTQSLPRGLQIIHRILMESTFRTAARPKGQMLSSTEAEVGKFMAKLVQPLVPKPISPIHLDLISNLKRD